MNRPWRLAPAVKAARGFSGPWSAQPNAVTRRLTLRAPRRFSSLRKRETRLTTPLPVGAYAFSATVSKQPRPPAFISRGTNFDGHIDVLMWLFGRPAVEI